MSALNIYEKKIASQIYNEEYINKLLLNFNFQKPKTIFDVYIKEKFKNNYDLYKNNINNRNPCKLFIDKFNEFSKNYEKLDIKQKSVYKKILYKENSSFTKNIEIIRKYIFKGVDGNIKFKKTAYQIFLSDELIKGLENGINIQNILIDANCKWKNLDLHHKEKYISIEKDNNNLLDIVQNYKKINSFLIFVFHYLKTKEFSKDNFPNIYNLANLFNNLPNKKKLLYEEYSNELIFLRFKLYDIYEAIHGINSKTPSGAIRIFLQEKAVNNEIKSIKEGKILWNNLSLELKENYLSKCHSQFLAYKYKLLIYNKKINRFLPKKPKSPFNIFLSERKGNKVPSGYNSLSYFRALYNNLSAKQKDKYNMYYKKQIENYNNKLMIMNNKIFDLPEKPKSGLVFYFKERLNDLYIQNKIDINEYIKKILDNWFDGRIDKTKYLQLAEKDKLRFESEVNEFESLGFYTKKK